MKGPIDEKLAIDACRYVLEEMPASEREAFERRLLEEQTARKAVVDAVEVFQVMKKMFAAAEERANWRPPEFIQPVATADNFWRRRALGVSLALAASVMIAVVLSGIGRDRQRHALQLAQPGVSDNSSGHDSMSDGMTDRGKQLAVAWLNFLPSPNDPTAALADDDDVDEVALVDPAAAPAGDTSASPTDDWLFQAVTAPAAESSSPAVTPLEG